MMKGTRKMRRWSAAHCVDDNLIELHFSHIHSIIVFMHTKRDAPPTSSKRHLHQLCTHCMSLSGHYTSCQYPSSCERLQSCQSLQEEEEEEEEAPRSRSKSRSKREAEVSQEEDDDFDDDDEHMTEDGEFKCSTVVADGLPKGAGIPTEVTAHPLTCTAALITPASLVCCTGQ